MQSEEILSTFSSLNNYIKPFYEIISNLSGETQYDLQYISTKITNEFKNEKVSLLGGKRKALYNNSSNIKRGESESGKKTPKKDKLTNKFTISKIRKQS